MIAINFNFIIANDRLHRGLRKVFFHHLRLAATAFNSVAEKIGVSQELLVKLIVRSNLLSPEQSAPFG